MYHSKIYVSKSTSLYLLLLSEYKVFKECDMITARCTLRKLGGDVYTSVLTVFRGQPRVVHLRSFLIQISQAAHTQITPTVPSPNPSPTSSWVVSIRKRAARPDLPHQAPRPLEAANAALALPFGTRLPDLTRQTRCQPQSKVVMRPHLGPNQEGDLSRALHHHERCLKLRQLRVLGILTSRL